MTTRLTVADRGHELAGVVRDGESWLAAAERTAGSLSGVPVAVDLSGAVKRFIIDHDCSVRLRAMTREDLPQVAQWRQQPHVHRWWTADGEPTLARVTEQYADDIDGTTPTRMWIAEVNGRPVAFLQDYRVGDYPDYSLLAPDPDAIGLDYAIGESECVGRGLGVRILWAWMRKARHRLPDAKAYFAAPDHRNIAVCVCWTRRASCEACGSTSHDRTAGSTPSSAAPLMLIASSAVRVGHDGAHDRSDS